MFESLKNLDINLFLYLNSKHSSVWDTIMYWISYRYTWIPLYAFFLILVFKKTGKSSWLVILMVGLLILSSDQLSVLIKNTAERYRPCQNHSIKAQVHILFGQCGGIYGFVSSHAANSFALSSFLFFLFRDQSKFAGPLLFAWAAVVCYSRIYSGVHYPLDIIAGGLLGILLGTLFFNLYRILSLNYLKNKMP